MTEKVFTEANFEASDFIDQVVRSHHEYLNNELPMLNQFVSKIAMVHGPRDEVLFDLEERFSELRAILEEYRTTEETLFTFILSKVSQEDLTSAVEKLKNTQDKVDQRLKQMREMTSNYTLPAHACRTYTMAFTKLEELESHVLQHLQLETELLFPRITMV